MTGQRNVQKYVAEKIDGNIMISHMKFAIKMVIDWHCWK